MTSSIISCAARLVLTVSVKKTKGMAVGSSVDRHHIAVGTDVIEVVD